MNTCKQNELTGFEDANGKPIREGDIVKYTEADYEELYTVTPYEDGFLLVSHEDYEYNAILGQIGPIEVISNIYEQSPTEEAKDGNSN